MKALEIVLAVLLSLVSLALIAIVTLQSGKEAGLSGALSGGSNDSYLSKSKTGNRDKLLASLTKWIALCGAGPGSESGVRPGLKHHMQARSLLCSGGDFPG